MKGKIRVFCRLRPLSEKEISEKDRGLLTSIDEFTAEHPWKDDKAKQHIYDRVFDGNATQEDVFEDTRVSFNVIFHLSVNCFNFLSRGNLILVTTL